ncbi:urea carboxylase-associated family protein [Brevibacterium sp. H602]|uniref:urea carboxylase-associated family protein n=1 Tax=Brevibacterium sp. H602 TaxID=3444316 RepID=UPI003EB93EEF
MTQSRLQEAAYQGPALEVDRDFYSRIGDDTQSRETIDEITIPIRSGQAWEVPAGHVCRISTVDGPQVGDLNLWHRHDPRERFWAARTRQLQAAHVSTFDRLWSTLPFLRPMATIVGDTLADYGTDQEGGRVHDTLGTRCDPYVSQMLSGVDFDYHCHSNLVRAILPYGLTEFDVHDVLNVFQCTGLNDNDEYFMKTCPARPGDHFEFFAEQDVLAALSTCPGGDLSAPMFGDGAEDPVENCHPLKVTVYRLPKDLLGDWSEPTSPSYRGAHGLRPQPWA